MKRISFIPVALSLALLAAQLGCASLQKPPYYYNPPEKADKTIERPNIHALKPRDYDIKLDEVCKKTKNFVINEPAKDSLLAGVEEIRGITRGIYKQVDGYQKKGAIIGGVIAGTGCFYYFMSYDYPSFWQNVRVGGSIFASTIAGLVGALVGSAVGGTFAFKKMREPLQDEKVKPLDSLVIRYNAYLLQQEMTQP